MTRPLSSHQHLKPVTTNSSIPTSLQLASRKQTFLLCLLRIGTTSDTSISSCCPPFTYRTCCLSFFGSGRVSLTALTMPHPCPIHATLMKCPSDLPPVLGGEPLHLSSEGHHSHGHPGVRGPPGRGAPRQSGGCCTKAACGHGIPGDTAKPEEAPGRSAEDAWSHMHDFKGVPFP